jgi:hypothetical protein
MAACARPRISAWTSCAFGSVHHLQVHQVAGHAEFAAEARECTIEDVA